MPKSILLTQGKFAIVDDEDHEWLHQQRWHAYERHGTWYAARGGAKRDGARRGRTIHMHREILQIPPGMLADHINHDGLDNRKCNLRIVTQGQNQTNRKPNRNAPSKYKGVRPNKATGEWRAFARINGKQARLGDYDTEKEAAKAYDSVVWHLYGQYAFLNMPDELYIIKGDLESFLEGPRRKWRLRRKKGCRSKYRGVYWHEPSKSWHARVYVKGNGKSAGYYKEEIRAAKARDRMAIELLGKMAILNFE